MALRQTVHRALSQCFRRSSACSDTTDARARGPKKGEKVVVGMSGGVDSSVTASLLASQDYDLSAVFMRNWDTRDESGTDKGCEWEKDWEDVQQVCKVIGLPCEMIDLSRDYWNRVFEPSLREWEVGLTPNPDVWCNREIKFGALLEHLPPTSQNGSKAWFATGHYARKSWSTPATDSSSRPKLIRASDHLKDQSYYLSAISEQGLRRALFPLGELTKPEVRLLAKKYNLPTAERGESMGLCFVGEKARFSNFISTYIPPNPGPMVHLTTGKHVGEHQGLWSFTVGQNVKIQGMPTKLFVARKDPLTNTIYVVADRDKAMYSDAVSIKGFSWLWKDSPPPALELPEGFRARVKIRHRMESVPCTAQRLNSVSDEIVIRFDTPEKAIASGQVAALYDIDGDWVLGCGVML